MTTIAWDGHILAVDSQSNWGHSVCIYYNKLRKIEGGYIAFAGDVQDANLGMSYLRGEIDKPDECNINALAFINGQLIEYEDKLIPHVYENPKRLKVASGSGWVWAQAAMDFGMNAIQAVEYASKRDIYTGGKVNWVEIFPSKKRKKAV